MDVEIGKDEDPLLNRTLTAAKGLVGEFSVATYNILADCHVDVDINYNYWPKQCLLKKERISDRHRRLIDEVRHRMVTNNIYKNCFPQNVKKSIRASRPM